MNLKELREVLCINDPEALTKYRGVYTYRVGFYYTHGIDHCKVRDSLTEALNKAGIDAVVLSSGEQRKPFRGGDTLKQGSHWWVKFQIIGEK